MVGVEVCCVGFTSQSAGRCLLCLAGGGVIIHINGRLDKTERKGSDPPSCVSRVALCLPSPCWQPPPLHIPPEEERGGQKKDWMCYCGVSYSSLLEGIFTYLVTCFFPALSILHFTTISTLFFYLSCIHACLSQFFFPPLSAVFSSSSLLHLSLSVPSLPLRRPSPPRVFIAVISVLYRLSGVLRIDAVTENE